MVTHDESYPPDSWFDRFLATSWFGYGFLAAGVAFLLVGLSQLLEFLGMDASFLMGYAGVLVFAFIPLFVLGITCRVLVRGLRRDVVIKPRTRLSRIAGILIGISILLFLIPMVLPAYRSAQQKAAQTSAENSPWSKHSFAGGSVQVQTPVSFRKSEAEGLGDTLMLTDSARNLQFMASAVPRRDVAANSIAELSDIVTRALLEGTPDAQVVDQEGTRASGHAMTRQTIEYADNGIIYVLCLEHHDLGSQIVELRFSATRSSFEKCQSEFRKISESLKLPD